MVKGGGGGGGGERWQAESLFVSWTPSKRSRRSSLMMNSRVLQGLSLHHTLMKWGVCVCVRVSAVVLLIPLH